MENSEFPNSRKRIAAELPALCTVKSSEEIHIFDTIDGPNDNITVNQNQQLGLPTTVSVLDLLFFDSRLISFGSCSRLTTIGFKA